MTNTSSALTAVDTPRPAEGNPPVHETVTGLVSGILDDAHKLLRQQLEMLRAEVKQDLHSAKRATQYGALGIVLLTVGFLGLVAALAFFLHEHYQFSMWASCGITGGIFLAIGAILAIASYTMLERVSPLPAKTFHALQENLQWKTKN